MYDNSEWYSHKFGPRLGSLFLVKLKLDCLKEELQQFFSNYVTELYTAGGA